MIAKKKMNRRYKLNRATGGITIEPMQMVPEEHVWDALKQCYDPEIRLILLTSAWCMK